MTPWPSKPFLYEINTWVWLTTLSQQYNQTITLKNVPDEVLDELAGYGVDAIWLMGAWHRSPQGARQAKQYAHEYRPALPDITDADIVGSPYAIYAYEVDKHFGGRSALAALRKRLAKRGLGLVLDYVPNHMGIDHPWIKEHPGYLMQGRAKDLKTRPLDFYEAEDMWGRKLVMAHGRDPYFPGWSDTVQINAFSPDLRHAVLDIILDIASQCDGIRCDMAMLMVNSIFSHTWQNYLAENEIPQMEFWDEIIPPVKEQFPDFKFIAEVYWNMEYDLQQQGFDYTYDKMLYDRMGNNTPRDVRVHLVANIEYQRKLVRFIENHDEERAYEGFGPQKSQPAAVLISTLPGMTLLHDGQFTGRSAKLPVQIGRQPDEEVDEALYDFYRQVLVETRSEIYQRGTWRLFNLFPAWSSNPTYDNLIAHGWKDRDDYRLVVVNLTSVQSQALITLSAWSGISGAQWQIDDALNGYNYVRNGDEMVRPGLFVDLLPFQSHIFQFRRL